MEGKKDNIYVYLWEEFNTVYIGRTKNPKSRHYAHKHRETEKTYQFSSKHHVEHPKMIIIENDLTIEEGVEREKYWIDHYRNKTNYNVLNIRVGGQVGNQHRVYTDEEMKEHKRKYYQENKEKRKEYQKKYYSENKEKIKEYFDINKISKKEYDKIYSKKWYEKNKKKKLEYMKQKNNAKL
jgi:hypothetical protein